MLSAIISFFIPGVGQIYNGQTKRGGIILGAYVVFWIVVFVTMLLFIGFLLMFLSPLFHIGAAADAYLQAGKINDGEITV
ncbi:hypothetical protein FYC77_17315 [Natrialba swarupiae]|uniref:TM2 domain-containing protein n=1 Tax=Natrialba swarupiae TaxID=2448032 RepID=A0A5D5AI09_9EURY|nr:hypothetical protein [Natrialba sp. INN-245]TYT60754.1 hypothetical protein FYC77_17315 [Natrialba swarupiae]